MRVRVNLNEDDELTNFDEFPDDIKSDEFMEELFREFDVVLITNKYLQELEEKVLMANQFINKISEIKNDDVKETEKVIYAGIQAQNKIIKNNEYKNEKVKCECGMEVCRRNMSRHKKSNKHLNIMKELNSSE